MATALRVPIRSRNTWKIMRINLHFLRKKCIARFASTDSSDVKDKPLPFSTSKAATWKAKYSLENVEDDSPKSQPLAIAISVSAILIYFCILREENDIDELLKNEDAWKAVPGLEKCVLETAIQEHSKLGADTSELEHELSKIKKQ